MIDISEYRLNKLSNRAKEIGRLTKEGGYAMTEACYAFAYKVREIDSQSKANQRNIENLNRNKIYRVK